MSDKIEINLSSDDLLEQIRSWFLKSILEIIGFSKINPSKIVDALTNYRNSIK